ncbi:uncharacterized protein [Phaenicophaeus curvirostris]|uniref:uncharacterized protein n=1 Tax=Phaenicophaeus curvirostris TaxID=33595 RepID=UPI0037F0C34D
MDRVRAICAIPEPRNLHELRTFLGMAGWCRLWIMDYGLIAKPLYEAQKLSNLIWEGPQKEAFKKLKEALTKAPALGLPDLTKTFQLFVHERQRLALGVLTQKLGSWKRPVGYFSKQLDPVSAGWPSCLRAVAATVILIQEARKLTLGKNIEVYVPHMVLTVLEQKGGHWLSPSQMMKFQAILTEQDDVSLKTTNLLNPAAFLGAATEDGPLEHDCIEVIEHTYATRADLKDTPIEQPDQELFTDGSSFMENGMRYAGYAVTTRSTVIEAQALPVGTSAQRAEIIALTKALELSKGKRVNIWTDSKYAFGVVHVHGALWKERGLLSSQGTNIKYQKEILSLISAVQLPEQVVIMHCKAHQRGDSKVAEGNALADRTDRRIARQVQTMMALIATKVKGIDSWIHYTRVKKAPKDWRVEVVGPTRLKLKSNPSVPKDHPVDAVNYPGLLQPLQSGSRELAGGEAGGRPPLSLAARLRSSYSPSVQQAGAYVAPRASFQPLQMFCRCTPPDRAPNSASVQTRYGRHFLQPTDTDPERLQKLHSQQLRGNI